MWHVCHVACRQSTARSRNLLETVCTDAARLARLHAERDLVPIVVEESLRHDSPNHVLMSRLPRGHHYQRCHDPGRCQGRLRTRPRKSRRKNL